MRIIGANLQDPEAFDRLQKMRPRPSNYITWGTTKELQEIYEKAKSKKMVKRDSKWILVSTDFGGNKIKQESMKDLATVITMTDDTCCPLLEKSGSEFFYDFLAYKIFCINWQTVIIRLSLSCFLIWKCELVGLS